MQTAETFYNTIAKSYDQRFLSYQQFVRQQAVEWGPEDEAIFKAIDERLGVSE